jgi:CheY-like chemotaxis protein
MALDSPRSDLGTSSPRHVLVVEDHADSREMLVEYLELEGYRVDVATNGLEALACLREGPRPDVVLLDLMMPVMNGEDFLRHVRQDPALDPVPVIIVTASGRTPLPGTQGILKKPFEISDLFATVTAHCPQPAHGSARP